MPAGPWPCMTRHMPWPRRDIVSRSASSKRWPTATLSANAGCAPSGSPPHICAKAFQVRSHACSATLAAAFEHPATAREPTHRRCGLASEHQTRPDQHGVAGRRAAGRRDGWLRGERASTRAWIPRHVRSSTRRARASRDRRDRAASAASAVANRAYASPHERSANDALACASSTSTVLMASVWRRNAHSPRSDGPAPSRDVLVPANTRWAPVPPCCPDT